MMVNDATGKRLLSTTAAEAAPPDLAPPWQRELATFCGKPRPVRVVSQLGLAARDRLAAAAAPSSSPKIMPSAM